MQNDKRTNEHQRKPEVTEILQELEGLIQQPSRSFDNTDYPILFIMGCARSGSTLLTQYLAEATSFCYPSNFISRFYYAPYTGSLLQRLMFDLDYKYELFGSLVGQSGNYGSELGKTKGPLEPNEFWYFWRRFFSFGEIQKISEDQLARVDIDAFVNELKSIQHVFQAPLFLKGMILNWNIPFLAQHIPNAYFVFIERDMAYNAQSLLLSRQEFFGNKVEWYSFKPEEYDELKGLSPEEQVVGQVYYTNKAIKEGLNNINLGRHLTIQYEDFCGNPAQHLDEIKNLINTKHYKNEEIGNKECPVSDRVRVSEKEWEKICTTLKKYSNK